MARNEDLLSLLKGTTTVPQEPEDRSGATVRAPEDVDGLAERLKKERKPAKKHISFYITRDLEDRLTDLRRKTDLSMTALIERLLEEVMGLK